MPLAAVIFTFFFAANKSTLIKQDLLSKCWKTNSKTDLYFISQRKMEMI